MDKKDKLGVGYSLDDFGMSFDDKNALDSSDKIHVPNLDKLRESHKDSQKMPETIDDSADSHYAPQFQGFDFSEQEFDLNEYDRAEHIAESSANIEINPRPIAFEKDAILEPNRISKQSEIGALFVAYTILFFVLLLFMPQIYLANNIYYASKNINYLKSQREALRDENGDLQQKLESLKFNFLTLEIEEIK